MATVNDHLKSFLEAVKDDPNLSDNFREAANELHEKLDNGGSSSKPTSKSKTTGKPSEG